MKGKYTQITYFLNRCIKKLFREKDRKFILSSRIYTHNFNSEISTY
uniref:Uncharacterized protein n=1 Tax=Tolypiocladia glomerulata TaxID=860646 RepID=A0A1Z1MUB0_9FLOR|nr:hypothetical protein [Tolypiocladia glomerulata]ARW69687.1 hypothetical protein [Tolypiocladia glomerulata]